MATLWALTTSIENALGGAFSQERCSAQRDRGEIRELGSRWDPHRSAMATLWALTTSIENALGGAFSQELSRLRKNR